MKTWAPSHFSRNLAGLGCLPAWKGLFEAPKHQGPTGWEIPFGPGVQLREVAEFHGFSGMVLGLELYRKHGVYKPYKPTWRVNRLDSTTQLDSFTSPGEFLMARTGQFNQQRMP